MGATHNVALTAEAIFALANLANQEAARFETMAELEKHRPNHSVLVWREHAVKLRALGALLLGARKGRK